MVCVEVENTGNQVTFYAVSRADGVSIAFSVSVIDMEPASPPVVTRALSQGRTKLMTLRAIPGKKPKFEHGFYWEWGVIGATHDDRVSYRLPFESQKSVRVFQGPNGAMSHQGLFAWDFPVPLRTPVCASRAGMVAEVVDEFDEGGTDEKLKDKANRILILHADGTLASYVHLLRGGMRVKPGDRVEAGTIIALSGNSGYSTGPHLHFDVFRKTDAMQRETLPVVFHTAEGDRTVLEEGKTYRAN